MVVVMAALTVTAAAGNSHSCGSEDAAGCQTATKSAVNGNVGKASSTDELGLRIGFLFGLLSLTVVRHEVGVKPESQLFHLGSQRCK